MTELKKWITTALLTLLLLPAMAQQKTDTTHSTAAVSGSSTVGGVVGNLGNNCSLTACYSTGKAVHMSAAWWVRTAKVP